MKKRIIFVITLLCFQMAQGQAGPTSSILLRSDQNSESDDDFDFDSDRYELKPQNKDPKSIGSSPSPRNTKTNITKKKSSGDKKGTSAAKNGGAAAPKGKEGAIITEEGKGRDSRKIILMRASRPNILELSVAPTYIYANSESPYWYRSYYTAGPGFQVGAKVWLLPTVGLKGSFLTSLNNEVKGDPLGNEFVIADHQWMEGGVVIKKTFRNHSQLLYGLDYSEYQFNVATDTANRLRLKSVGVRLYLEGYLAHSKSYFWILGSSISPRVQHEEIETGLSAKSGQNPTTNLVEFWLGGKYQFNRKYSMFWKIHHQIEKNQYESRATEADPVTGNQPEGVPVTNGISLFQIGFTWGS